MPGLQDYLMQKVDEGFTFPLNPKWLLCDSRGWYELYQKLLLSENEETQQSMNVWYPPDSGLREQIERVHNMRPEGFYEKPAVQVEFSDNVSGISKEEAKAENKEHLISLLTMGLLDKSQNGEEEKVRLSTTLSPKKISKSKSPMKSLRKKVKGKLTLGKNLQVIEEH